MGSFVGMLRFACLLLKSFHEVNCLDAIVEALVNNISVYLTVNNLALVPVCEISIAFVVELDRHVHLLSNSRSYGVYSSQLVAKSRRSRRVSTVSIVCKLVIHKVILVG